GRLVPVRVRQGAEVQGREWLWTKASVRPERMLAALATASKRHIANAFSRHIGCSPFVSLCRRANPDEATTDWRAVCGRTARTVRRAGTAKAVPDPYRTSDSQQSWRSKLRGIDLNENKKQIRRDSTDQLRVLIREITDRAMHMKLQINIDVDDLEGGEAFY